MRLGSSALAPLLTTIVIAIGAGCPGGGGGGDVPCSQNIDCPGTQLCISGRCGDPTNVLCNVDQDCPTGFICLENGRRRGQRACVNGHFALCDAAEVTPGVDACGDDVDNDCNGTVDDGCPVCAQGDT